MIVTDSLDVYYFTAIVFLVGAIFGIFTKAIAKAWHEICMKITKA